MKLFHYCFLLFLPLLVLSCSINEDKLKPNKYTCQYTDYALRIDGKLDEVQWKSAAWSGYFIDIEGKHKPAPKHKTKMKMLWSKHYLYIAAELEEPHLWATLTERDAIIYRDNDFEVFIDPDGDGLNYYELEIAPCFCIYSASILDINLFTFSLEDFSKAFKVASRIAPD